MLDKRIINDNMFEIINKINSNKIFENFILVGGTALSLQILHRTSTDLDFFKYGNIDNVRILDYLKNNFNNVNETYDNNNFLQVYVNNVKVEFVEYEYKFIRNPVIIDNLKIADKKEIAAMKMKAIKDRVKTRDFIDIAYLFKEMSLNEMFDMYREKYGSISELWFKRTIISKFKSLENYDDMKNIKMLKSDINVNNVLEIIIDNINMYNKNIIKENNDDNDLISLKDDRYIYIMNDKLQNKIKNIKLLNVLYIGNNESIEIIKYKNNENKYRYVLQYLLCNKNNSMFDNHVFYLKDCDKEPNEKSVKLFIEQALKYYSINKKNKFKKQNTGENKAKIDDDILQAQYDLLGEEDW